MSLFVGIDLGSSETKIVVLDPQEGVVATAGRPVSLHTPRTGWAEADTARWRANVCHCIRDALRQLSPGSPAIAGVACSGMVPAVVCCDAAMRPLRPAILQNDARAVTEIAELRQALSGTDLLQLTGSALSQQSVAPTLLWLARHEPDLWHAARHVVGSYDWLSAWLGAPPHVEHNWAVESGLFQLSGERLEPVIRAAGLTGDVVPDVRTSGTVVGEVSAEAAAQTGMPAGIPIVVGGADHVMSAYGAGLSTPGDWLVKLGSAGDVLVVTPDVFIDERLYLDAHPSAGKWLPNGCMATSGSLIRWMLRLIGAEDPSVMDGEAAERAPAALLCLPYFLGEKSPLHDPELRGAFLGLHLGHDRADLYRSVLEAIGYGFRHHADIFAERGVRLGRARVTNGGSRSRLWKQILATILGTPLVPVLGHPGAALGAAFAAAVGTGEAPGWSAIEALVTYGDVIEPQAKDQDRYDEAYQLYREAAASLAPLSHQLARW